MAMAQRFYNNFSTTLSSQAGASSAQLYLSTYPEMDDGDWCWLTIQANIGIFTVIEIVKATKENGAISFERGQQSTISSDFPAGSKIENRATADDYARIQTQLNDMQSGIESRALNFNALVVSPIV